MLLLLPTFAFFFFNDTATTEIYTLSLHDALPISSPGHRRPERHPCRRARDQRDQGQHAGAAQRRGKTSPLRGELQRRARRDRKSTRLNSSHGYISYAVFCLKKKKKKRK